MTNDYTIADEALSDLNPFEDLSYAEVVAELNRPRLTATSNYEKVKEFNRSFGKNRDVWPPTQALVDLQERLIFEELEELKRELHDLDFVRVKKDIDKKKFAKELADLLYVGYDMAVTFGIDIDRVFAEVHRSNMSKLGEDGKPIYRDDGKVLKGPNYREADLSFVK